MKRYSSYKDSGVEWLDYIPTNWGVKRLKYGVNLITEKGSPLDGEIKISPENVESDTGKCFNLYSDYTGDGVPFIDGDVLLNKLRLYLKKILITDYQGYSMGEMLVFRTNTNLYNKYLYNLLFHQGLIDYLDSQSQGIKLPRVSPDVILNTNIPLPPLNEQHQIVSYLDDKTSLIDTLIQSKQKKITLLKEKRTSLINHVVTKGLNPNVEMKDSGVEWIGEIPKGWKSTKLGFYTTKIGSGSTPRGGSEVYVDDGIPFIRSQNVHFQGLILENISFIDLDTHNSMKGSTVRNGDVLLNITGGSIGRCCVVMVDVEMNVNQHVSIIRTKNSLLNLFLNYILNSDVGQLQVEYNVSGGNREGLTIEGIRDFLIPLPPIHEQHQIVEYLDNETSLIDKTISIEERKIELLKEYKQSLISDVVTGKICVLEDG